MKKYFFTAAALLIAASCTRELPETPSPVNEGELVSFTIENARGPVLADKDQDGSRTALGNLTGSVVNWTAGDNAILFDNSGSCAGHLFTGSVQSDNTKINLSGEMHEGSTAYWLLYPYNSNASLSSGVITTTLSASQNAVAGSFADKTAISLAKGTRTPGETGASGLTFDNLCAVLAITIPTYVDNAQSVTIAANNGTAMAGSISFNASTGAMTAVSGASSITLNGPLNAGQTYFAVVAPANYTGGFTLTLTTAGNNTYSAATTRDLNAQKGTVYKLGTLGVKLNVTPTLTITHTENSSKELNGTDAALGISVPAELAAMIDSWALTLKNSNNVVVRNYESTSGTGEVANGYAYLPQGTYTLTGTYTTKDGKTRTLPSVNATSPAPTFSVKVTGYTSYDCYKGTNDQAKSTSTANSLDGSTVYGLGTRVTIASALMNDNKYSKTYTYTYDSDAAVSVSGNSASYPNKSGQNWDHYSINTSCTFDGVEKSDSKTVHVTGLPWVDSSPSSANWTLDGQASFESGYINLHSATALKNANATTKKAFYCPENLNVKVTTIVDMYGYQVAVWYRPELRVSIAGTRCITQMADKYKGTKQYTNSGDGTISSSNSQIKIESYQSNGNPYIHVKNVKLEYR